MNWPFVYWGESPFNNFSARMPSRKSGGSGSSKDSLQKLIDQFTGKVTEGTAQNAWRRQNPTNTTDLLRQLSFNAGEMGMPGGYVGGVQMPAYNMPGPQLPAINNPDMKMYGRTPGYGEATFYQQSMNGGMAPISAMSPLGVPADWKPGGNFKAPSSSLQAMVDAYLKSKTSGSGTSGGSGGWDGSGGSGGSGGLGFDTKSLQKQLEDYLKSISPTASSSKKDYDKERD